MMDMAGLVQSMMIPLVVVVVIVMIAKIIIKQVKKRSKSKKKDKPRGEMERIYVGIKEACKKSNLMKHKPVYVKGDSAIPQHKIGETATGIISTNEERYFFIRSKWWKVWETPRMIRVEPELMGDLNAGDVVIKGVGVDPISEKEYYVTPPAYYHENVKPDELAERRAKVALTQVTRLLERDLNDDSSFAIKQGMRGSGELAMMDMYKSGEPPKKSEEQLQREQERKYEEAQEERKKQSMSPSNPLQEMQQGGV